MILTTRIMGNIYENRALSYLKKQGLKLIARNYKSAYGEIDLIMQDVEIMVFVEVRARKSSDYGSPVDTVTKTKQRKIIKTAQKFIVENDVREYSSTRFDVVGIEAGENYTWIKNAFTIDG